MAPMADTEPSDDDVAAALREEFGGSPDDAVVARHLVILREESARLRSRRRRAAIVRRTALTAAAAVAITVGVVAVQQVVADRPAAIETTTDQGLPAVDPDRSEPTDQASTTTTPPPGDDEANGGASSTSTIETGGGAGEGTDTAEDASPPSGPGGPGPGADPSATDDPAQPTSSTTPDADPTTSSPSDQPTTTAATTTTPAEPTTTVSIPAPIGASFQERLLNELFDFNACLGGDNEIFVGYPGESDHPRADDPAYRAAIERCDPTTTMRQVLDDHVAWETSLDEAQKAAVNAASQPAYECISSRGWDVGTLFLNERGVLTFSRFPEVTWGEHANGSFEGDLRSCGWYALELG